MARASGRQATRNERQPLPFWVGLVAGFFLGIVAASVFIYRDYNLERQRAADAGTRPTPALTPPAHSPPTLPPRLLEPVAPSPTRPESFAVAPATAPATPVATPPAAAPAPAPAATSGGRSLVAGSLRSEVEAEQRKAELALLGVSSRVVRATVNGEQRYRVTIGPFRSDADLEQTRAQLKNNGVDSFPTQ